MFTRILTVFAIGAAAAWWAGRVASEQRCDKRLCGVGVNLAGAEFGADRDLSNASPGVAGLDYTYNGADTLRATASSGLRFVRLPFRWERVQPRLGGPLDSAEIGRLSAAVELAERHGLSVLLDLHNYGRYRIAVGDKVVEAVIDRSYPEGRLVTRDHLADAWRRLAEWFVGSPAVVGYGVMNEPHDMGDSDWRAISQSVVDAIRTVDRQTCIVVAGDGWSSAFRFTEHNGPDAWIDDPAGKTAYEAHAYFDHNASGKHRLTYEQELARDADLPKRGRERVADFLAWLDRNGVPGLLGEVGVPIGEPGWLPLLKEATRSCSAQGVPVCLWAAGEWWGDYSLSLQEELLGARSPVTLRAALGSAEEMEGTQ